MKKIKSMAGVFIVLVMASCTAQHVGVRVRPAPVVTVRTMAPSPRHIWVDGDWIWNGREYTRKPGYWIEPRRGYNWAPGHWKNQRGNWYWMEGHWKR